MKVQYYSALINGYSLAVNTGLELSYNVVTGVGELIAVELVSP